MIIWPGNYKVQAFYGPRGGIWINYDVWNIETLVPNVNYKDRKRYLSEKRLLFLFVPNRFEVTFGEFLNVKPYRSWGKKKRKRKKKTDITVLESLSSYASCTGKQKGGVPKGSLHLYFSLFKLKGRWKLSKIIVWLFKGTLT